MEANENKNTTYQTIWDVEIAGLRENFIAVNTHIEKEERLQIHNLT